MSGRCRAPQRIVVGLAAAVVAVVVVLVAPGHLQEGSIQMGPACAAAAPAQANVNVGVVVDFGVLAPGTVQVTCVPVPPGTNGYDMLTAAGHQIRIDGSGLVCAIDGLPATGCGDRSPTGYRYWAYFHGSGSSWRYSSIGPGSYYAAAGTVEGWHFVEGAGNPNDPPPARAPTNICPSAPPPTVAPTTAPAPVPPPPPTPAPPTTAAAAAPNAPGAVPPASTVPGASPGPSTPTTSAAVGGDLAEPEAIAEDGATAGEAPPGSVADPSAAPGTTTIGEDGVASDVTVLAAAQAPSSGPEGGAPIATIVAVLVVVGLGGAAAWRFRNRSDATP